MTKVALPSYDVQTVNGRAGGVGVFITKFARLLKARGDDVSIILTTGATEPLLVDRTWRDAYRSWGIELIEIHNKVVPNRWPDVWTVRLSECLTPFLRGFDVAYFGDWGNVAFNTVRLKRYGVKDLPTCVTVLHGPSAWVQLADGKYPIIPDHLNLDFVERYSARHSDYVVAPSRFIVDWAKSQGWIFPREPEVLGLPYWPEQDLPSRGSPTQLRRIIFFGRLQPRKGYDLFVAALRIMVADHPEIINQIDEVILLGPEDDTGAVAWVQRELGRTGLRVTHLGNLDSVASSGFLAKAAEDSLVVVPSRFENFPYAVIEASLVPGLNLICTSGGGAPEIFAGRGDSQLFEPAPHPLAAKIYERLRHPLADHDLPKYDFETSNKRWIGFHEQVCDQLHRRKNRPDRSDATPTIDVCVSYFNKGRHFHHLLKSLEIQTFRNFRVIAIDDGSSEPESVATFDEMAKTYRRLGWLFFRQDNQFVDVARNRAASHSVAEYLLFIDADDVLAKDALEKLVQAARISGDDCLTPGTLRFAGDDFPYDPETGQPISKINSTDMPLGANLAAGLVEPSVFGGHVILIRREVFEKVGGYREVRGAAHEDWELHARLAFAGLKTDVLPEYLHYYRQLDDSLSRKIDPVPAQQRIIDTFDRHLGSVGLFGAASAMHAMRRQTFALEHQLQWINDQIRLSLKRVNAFGVDFSPRGFELDQTENTPSVPRTAKIKVLVVIPTLNIGGAEIDLVRNLPLVDRNLAEVVVFTFWARGALASQLVDAGIEVIGPILPIRRAEWPNLRRLLQLASARLLMIARSILIMMPEPISAWIKDQTRPVSRWIVKFARTSRASFRLLRLRCRQLLRPAYSALIFFARAVARRLPFIHSPWARKIFAWPTYVMIGTSLGLYIRRREFNVIHTVLPNSYVVGMTASFLANRRPVVMSRVSLNWYQQQDVIFRRVEREFLHPVVSRAVGNCNAVLDDLRHEGLPDSKLRLIRNGIDVADFTWRMIDRDAARERLGLSRSAIVFSVTANLHPYKGHADLLRGLFAINGSIPEWTLVAAGRDIGGNLAKLQASCIEFGLSSKVMFLGERQDIPVILSASDIHVSASHTEGLPNNIIEAMCARLPVVATAAGATPELVVDMQTGLLVPTKRPIELGRAMERLAHDATMRHAMGDAGYRRVTSEFSIERSVSAFEGIYGEFVA